MATEPLLNQPHMKPEVTTVPVENLSASVLCRVPDAQCPTGVN
jgi:hypothetical protein